MDISFSAINVLLTQTTHTHMQTNRVLACRDTLQTTKVTFTLPVCIVLGFNYGKVLCRAICVSKLARLLPLILAPAILLPWCFGSNVHCIERQGKYKKLTVWNNNNTVK